MRQAIQIRARARYVTWAAIRCHRSPRSRRRITAKGIETPLIQRKAGQTIVVVATNWDHELGEEFERTIGRIDSTGSPIEDEVIQHQLEVAGYTQNDPRLYVVNGKVYPRIEARELDPLERVMINPTDSGFTELLAQGLLDALNNGVDEVKRHCDEPGAVFSLRYDQPERDGEPACDARITVRVTEIVINPQEEDDV